MHRISNIINKNKLTFQDLAHQWLEIKKREIKKSTYSNYVYTVEKYLLPKLSLVKLKNLEKIDFNVFIEELAQNLSPKTVRDILCNLKSILYLAEEEYECKINIKKIKGPKMNIEPLVILSDREIRKLEHYCLKINTLRSIGIIICLNTGLRIGEICALKWENIDLSKRELYIKNTLQRIYNKGTGETEIIIDTAKTKTSVRTIPITNKLYFILNELKSNYKPTDFFITGNSEKSIEPRTYQITFKNYLKKIRIKPYKFHILRHTFATKCIEMGMDIKSLSEILGHSNVEITLNKYVHSSYKRKKKFLEKL